VDRAAARRALETAAPGEWLEPEAVDGLLAAYGIRSARFRRAWSAGEASAAQADLGVPVAVKAVSRELVHKRDVGAVALGCASPEAAAAAYDRVATACERAVGAGAMDGVLVQEMIEDGLEVIVGATCDAIFGPLVLAGIGGVEAELWRDRAVALAPVGPATAEHLWQRLRGAPLIDGWRGGQTADRAALIELAVRVSRMAAEQPLLAELDCNPVRSAGSGGGVVVLDARARRAGG
jgi:acyl-CoA synthetase (NDP forming)